MSKLITFMLVSLFSFFVSVFVSEQIIERKNK